MAAIQRFSDHLVDYAERLSDMADAAEGKRGRRQAGRVTRWALLPASGAALYALVRSDYFSRRAKDVVDEAKTKAAEVPDDLMARVRELANGSSAGNGSTRSSRKRSTKKRSSSKAASSTR